MKPVRSHTFNGQRYHIYVHPPVHGFCDSTPKNMELYIFEPLRSKNGLITSIHEALHAENRNTPEEVVERMGREIGSFLWRLGYRWKPSRK